MPGTAGYLVERVTILRGPDWMRRESFITSRSAAKNAAGSSPCDALCPPRVAVARDCLSLNRGAVSCRPPVCLRPRDPASIGVRGRGARGGTGARIEPTREKAYLNYLATGPPRRSPSYNEHHQGSGVPARPRREGGTMDGLWHVGRDSRRADRRRHHGGLVRRKNGQREKVWTYWI